MQSIKVDLTMLTRFCFSLSSKFINIAYFQTLLFS